MARLQLSHQVQNSAEPIPIFVTIPELKLCDKKRASNLSAARGSRTEEFCDCRRNFIFFECTSMHSKPEDAAALEYVPPGRRPGWTDIGGTLQ